MRRHLGDYVALVADSFRTMFTSPADYSWIQANHRRINSITSFEERVLGQRKSVDPVSEFSPAKHAPKGAQVEWVVVLAYIACVSAAAFALARSARRRTCRMSPANGGLGG